MICIAASQPLTARALRLWVTQWPCQLCGGLVNEFNGSSLEAE